MAVVATGNETLVNATTAGEQSWPRVARFADGSYIVVWIGREDLNNAGSDHAVYFQRYDAAGNKVERDGSPLVNPATSDEVHVNTTTAGNQFYPRITTLSNGSFVITWSSPDDSNNDVYAQLYDSNGAAIGGEVRVDNPAGSGRQAEPSVAEISGGYVISWASSNGDGSDYGIFAQRFDTTGNFVAQDGTANGNTRANFQVNQTTSGTQGWHDLQALSGGRILHLYSTPDSNAYGVVGRIQEADGSLGAQFAVSADISTVDYQIWSDAIQLNNGNIVVSWIASGQDGSGYGIYARIFDSAGNALGAEFRVNVNVWGSQGDGFTHGGPSMVALADGGFAIAYHSDTGDGSARAVFVRRYDAAGHADGGETLVNQYTTNHQFGPDLVATSDGFRVFWHSEGQDGSSWGVYTRDFDVTAFQVEQQILRTGGEDQVNTETPYAQQASRVASFADGSYVITWISQTGVSTGDGSGWGIFGQRYSSSGQQVGAQFQVNEYVTGDQGRFEGSRLSHSNAALADGRFIVTWDSNGQPGGNGWDSYARIFNANGTPATNEFRVNSAARVGGEDAFPDVAMLTGGGFIVTYRAYENDGSGSYDVWGQRYDAAGNAIGVDGTPGGTEFKVTDTNGANTDGSEHQGRVMGLTGGGWVVVFQDSGNDGSGEGIYGRTYTAAGVAGTTFLANQQTGGDQYSPAVAALQNGNFVVTWTSTSGDVYGYGVRARIFAADGTAVTDEFLVNDGVLFTQADPQVVTLVDGSFIIVFMSEEPHNNAAGDDIFAVRYDQNGNQIGTEFQINRDISAGNERWPRIAATENGFVVTWEQESGASDEGDQSGIFRQEFTIDGLNAAVGQDQADVPTLTVVNAQGAEDSAIALNITAVLNDTTGSNETSHLEIGGIPVGATISDGTNSFTATAFAHAVSIDGWNLATLTITPPLNRETDFTIEVRLTAIEPGPLGAFDSESVVKTITIDVLPQPEAVIENARSTRVNTYMPADQQDPQIARATDGSYLVTWHSAGQDGDSYGVYGQRYNADGTPAGGEFRVSVNTVGSQDTAHAVYLDNGTFVVTWDDSAQDGSGYGVYQRIFDATTGAPITGEVRVNNQTSSNQHTPAVIKLGDGDYLIAWQSLGQDGSNWGIYAQRYDVSGTKVNRDGSALTGGATHDEFILNTTTGNEQSQVQIAATAGGGFIAVWHGESQPGDPGRGVYGQRFDANGAPVGPEFHVNQSTDEAQEFPQIAVLSNGNFVVAWHSASGADPDGSSWGVMARLYDAAGNPLTNEFLVNTYQNNDQSWPSIAALDNGGFAIAWNSAGQDGDGYGVYYQRFDAEGDKIGQESWLASDITASDRYPRIVADGNGLIGVWQNDPAADGSSWGILIREVDFPTETVLATGGERVVPATTPHQQSDANIATLPDGGYLVVWQTLPSSGTGDVSSWSVRAQRYDAEGNRVNRDGSPLTGGATHDEFTVNTNVQGDQSQGAVVALDGGGWVVVWHSATGDSDGSVGIYGQRFNADGTTNGAEFRVALGIGGNQQFPEVTALHGDQAGGFAVSWQNSSNIYVRAFDADGDPISSDILVNIEGTRVTGNDSTEIDADLVGTADGGFIVTWEDHDADGSGRAVMGQRFSISGVTVSATTGTNWDGSTSANNFRVNSTYPGSQYQASIAALADGGSIIVYYNDGGPQGAGVYGQLYNADGTLRGGQFNIDGGMAGAQYEPEVTGLSDGSFVVVWRDQRPDDKESDDVFGRRYDANGTLLNEFSVNSGGNGQQMQPVVTEVGDGFTVVWTSSGAQDGYGFDDDGGEAYGVHQQHFTIDRGAGVGDPVAQTPTLTVTAVSAGNEDTVIALGVAANLNDAPGGAETLSLVIENVPIGAVVSDGTNSFTSMLANPSVNIAGWSLANLTIKPPADYNGSFTLNLLATAKEATGDVAFNAATIRVDVAPVDEVLGPYGAERQDNVFTFDNQYEPDVAVRADGSYLVVWRTNSQNNPSGYNVMGQLHAADGSKVGTEFAINTQPNNAYTPNVIALAGGDYLVSFTHGNDSSGEGIYAQRVSATGTLLQIDGSPLGGPTGEVRVNNTVPNNQGDAHSTALADGGWVTVWTSEYQDSGVYENRGGIFAQRFDASGQRVNIDGTALTGPPADTQVNVAVEGYQQMSSVAEMADGSLVFTWTGPDSNGYGIFGRIFYTNGTSTGDIAVSTANFDQYNTLDGYGGGATVATLPDGRAVFVWLSIGQDGNGRGIYGRIMNDDGSLPASEFRVNSYGYDYQQEPRIETLPDGGFVVVWTSHQQDGSSWGVYGQRYDSAGHEVGTEFRINRSVGGDQSSPAVAVQPDGSGLIVAYEGQDGNNYGVYDVRLELPDANEPQAIERAGLEQQVNTTTAANQSANSVARLADGSYVVTWQSNNQDGSSWGVYARHYDADGDSLPWGGVPGANEKLINISTSGDQSASTIAALPDGGFVIVWHSGHNGNYDIMARRFDSAGDEVQMKDSTGTLVSELLVSSSASSDFSPSIAVDEDGSFTVSWSSDRSGASQDVYAHHFTNSGGFIQRDAGPDIQLNQNLANSQQNVSISALSDGSFVVVWESYDHDGSDWGIYGRLLDSSGAPIGQEFLINTNTDATQLNPSVAALSGGGFVVVWQATTGFDADGSGYGIAGQRYLDDGTKVGGEFTLNGIARDSQQAPTVIATQDGGFVVGWMSENADGSANAVYGRRFDADGVATEPFGNDFQINTYTNSEQVSPVFALLERGFVAVWSSAGQDGDDYSVQMQRFEGAGLEPPPYIVDSAHGDDSASDLIFNTIQEALDALETAGLQGRTLLIREGANGGVYNESVTVNVDDLRVVNEAGKVITINGTSGGPAFTVGNNINITFRGDFKENLVINGGAGQHAILFLGDNNDTIIDSVTVTAVSGQSAVFFVGDQNGIAITDSSFSGGGGATPPLVFIFGGNNFTITGNTFTMSAGGGSGLVVGATGSTIKENTFTGVIAPNGSALSLFAGGSDVQTNNFTSTGGPYIRDVANGYTETTLIAQNSLSQWARIENGNIIYASLSQAIGATVANDRVFVSGGDWSSFGTVTVNAANLKISAPADAAGINLALGGTIAAITLEDAAPINVTGNASANTITGNAGNNVLSGGDGTDTLYGNAGNDTLNGGNNADILDAGDGNDTLNGDAGDDTLTIRINNTGVDTVDGGSGTDIVTVVTVEHQTNDDFSLSANGAITEVKNGAGIVRASITGVETIVVTLAAAADLTVGANLSGVTGVFAYGDGGNNDVNSSAATTDVTFVGGDGFDSFTGGGSGVDTIRYDNGAGTPVYVNLGTTDLVVGPNTIAAGTALDEFGDTDTLSGIDRVVTGAGADHIRGGAANETIESGAGADTVDGGAGNDTIDGGTGDDDMTGGLGDDVFFVDSLSDVIHENSDEGTDEIRTALASYSLAAIANVENLTGTNNAGQTLTGNTLNNRITGAAGVDTINGGGGDDTLIGLAGADNLTGGGGTDTVDYSQDAAAGGTAGVTVNLGANTAVDGFGATDTLSGIANARGTGQIDTLTGDGNANTLYGEGDNDILRGGGGNDRLEGGLGTDEARYLAAPTDGMVAHSSGELIVTTGGAEDTDTLNSVERIRFAGTDQDFGTSDDQVYDLVSGNFIVHAFNDANSATEAGGFANGTAGSNATGNVLNNDINLDANGTTDVERITHIVWTSATGPGPDDGDTSANAVSSGSPTVTVGRYGSLSINEDGSYTYTPDASKSDLLDSGESANEVFTYTVDDGSGNPVTATLTITLNGTNDAPVASNVSVSGSEDDASIGGSASATDADIEDLTYALVTGSVKINNVTAPDGTVTFNPDGTYSYTTGAADQALDDGETRVITFDYTASDGDLTSVQKTATITVNGANDAPVTGGAGSATGNEDQASIGGTVPTASDVDIEGLTYSLVAGSVKINGNDAPDGTVTFNPDGTYSYTTIPGDQALDTGVDKVITFSYRSSDGTAFSAPATITLTVTGINDAPVAATTGGTTAFVEGNNVLSTPVVVDAGFTVSDVDDTEFASAKVAITGGLVNSEDVLAFTNDNATTFGNISASFNSTTGELTLTSSGSTATAAQWQAALRAVTYTNSSETPNAATRTISFTVNDGEADSNTVTKQVSVQPVNDWPINTVGGAQSVNEDTALVLTGVQISDVDRGSGLMTVHLSVAHGTLNIRTDVAGGITSAMITGGGQGTNGITLTATQAQINTTLAASNALTYQGDPNYFGADALSVATYDGIRTDAPNFAAKVDYTTAANSGHLLTADLNGDLKADLVYIGGGQVNYRLGNGDGTFAAEQQLSGAVNAAAIAVADINGDGRMDISVANYNAANGNLGVYYGAVGGGFGAFTAVGAAGSAPHAYDVVAVDLNNDGRLDLIADERDIGVARVFLQNVGGTFTGLTAFNVGISNYTKSILTGDYNGDGNADLVTINAGNNATGNPPGQISLLLGKGDGTFLPLTTIYSNAGANTWEGVSGDFDGDGNLDIAFTNLTPGSVTVLYGNGNGTFQAPSVIQSGGNNHTGITAGDINGDGRPDLVVGAQGSPGTAILLINNGNRTFQSATSVTAVTNPDSVALADFDGDGDLDLAVDNTTSANISVFLNQIESRGDIDTKAITVNSVNDAPVNNGTIGAVTVAEDASVVVTGLSITDVDAGGGNLTVTLVVTHGTLTLATSVSGGLTAGQIAGNGTGSITITASQSAINATLANAAGLTYTPPANLNGSPTLTITTNDNGNAGLDPGLSGNGSSEEAQNVKAITVTPVNDAPIVSGDGTEAATTILEDSNGGQTISALFGGQFSDAIDNSGASTANTFVGVAVIANGSSAGTGQWQWFNGFSWADIGTVSASSAKLFTAATSLRFNPAPDYNGAAPTLTVKLIDSSGAAVTSNTVVDLSAVGATGGTTRYSSGSVVLSQDVTAVNDAPVNNGIAGTVTVDEDASVVVSGLSITDVDVASGNLTVTLAVGHGTLTLATSVGGGVTAGQVTGNGTGSVTITASLSAINATLADAAGLTYAPTANFNGADDLTITTNDNGNTGQDPGLTGTGSNEQDQDVKSISVTAVNDAPVVSGDGTESATNIFEDTPSAVGQTVAALFGGQFSDATDTVSGGSSANTLAGVAVIANGSTAGAGQWQYFNGSSWVDIGTVSASSAKLFNASTAFRFNPALDYNGVAPTLTVKLVDSSGSAITDASTVDLSSGGASGGTTRYSTGTVVLSQSVTALNDAPVNNGIAGAVTVDEDGSVVVSGLSISDLDVASGNLTVTLAVGNGTLTLSTAVGGGVTAGQVTGNGTGMVIVTASLSAINATLANAAGLTYAPTADYDGAESLTITTNDNGNTGNDPGLTGDGTSEQDQDVKTITITPVNDAPVVDLNGATGGTSVTLAYTENAAATAIAPAGTVVDIDSANLDTGTLTVSFTAGGIASDRLTIIHQGNGGGQIGVAGNAISFGGVQIATFAGGDSGSSPLVISLDPDATPAAVQALLRQIAYANISDDPGTSRTLSFVLTDGDGGTSIAATATVNITTDDDAPVATADSNSTPEDVQIINASVFGNDVDPDGPPLQISAVNGSGANVGTEITLGSGAKLTVNSDGTYSYNPNGKFNYLAAAGSGATNTEGTDSFTYTLAGGNTVTVTLTITGVAGNGDQPAGDSGNNVITGSEAGDLFLLQQGGDDSASGGGGNDGFYFGAAMTGADEVDGGAGNIDQIGLQGNYTGVNALTLGALSTVGIEMIVLLPGSDSRFGDTSGALYSYDITTVDANVGAGQTFIINANTLRAGENFTFDGSAELDGTFLTFGGLGNDDLTGGQRTDGFFFGNNGRFGAGDKVDGQGQEPGGLDQIGFQGNYAGINAITLGADQLTNIEMIVLLSGADTRFGGNSTSTDLFDYDLTTHDGNVGAGQKMIINGNTLLAAETLNFDGSAETDGFFQIFSGAGDDTLIGGEGDDEIWGGGGADTIIGELGADELHGAAGNDVFRYLSAAESVSGDADSIVDFETGDTIDLSAIDAITGGGDDEFQFVGSAAFVNNGVGQLRAVNTSGNDWTVSADVDGNGSVDLEIAVTVADAHNLTAADFVL